MKWNLSRKFTIREMVLFIFMPVLLTAVLFCGSITYILLNRQLRDNTFSNAVDITTQLQLNLNYRLEDIYEKYESLLQGETMKQFLAGGLDAGRMQKEIDSLYTSRSQMLDSILLAARIPQGDFILFRGQEGSSPAKGISEETLIRSTKISSLVPGEIQWANLHEDALLDRKELARTTMLYSVVREGDAAALLVFQIREDFFRELLAQAKITEHGYLSLLSKDGEMVFKEIGPDSSLTQKDLDAIVAGTAERNFSTKSTNGQRLLVISEPLAPTDWKILAVFPEKEILGAARYIKYVYLYSIVILILLTFAMSNMFAKVFSRPIQEWIKNVHSAEKGKLDVTFHDNNCEEIAVLNDGLQALFQKMGDMVREMEQEHQTKRELEMAILQAQINPHFLYNTLYSIQQLYGMGENQTASKMVGNLSNFFRLSLSKGRELIPIRDEIEHLKSYMAIQQIRYDQITYELSIDERLMDINIIKLTLQPLVENAISHGLFSARRGHIRVKGRWADSREDIIFTIRDNGSGIPPENLDTLNCALKTGDWSALPSAYGIKNVHQRIQLYYGPSYGLSYESELDKGTTVTVRISSGLKETSPKTEEKNMDNPPETPVK